VGTNAGVLLLVSTGVNHAIQYQAYFQWAFNAALIWDWQGYSCPTGQSEYAPTFSPSAWAFSNPMA